MRPEKPVPTNYFNPVDQRVLAESAVNFLLRQEPIPLSGLERFNGAGVYLLFYSGPHAAYTELSRLNSNKAARLPIYVGKADPKGTRQGGDPDSLGSYAAFTRIKQHIEKIEATELDISDFYIKYVVLDFVWIGLVEATLINHFRPLWNSTINGFGNKIVGAGRANQKASKWDVLHPGTGWTRTLKESGHVYEDLVKKAQSHIGEMINDLRPEEIES